MTGSKRRPAVVVQADFLNGLIDDTILEQITTTRHGIPGTEVLLDPAIETGSGLSKVYCDELQRRARIRWGHTRFIKDIPHQDK
jgi:mRNA-degrading endonuclease toxin of MazEF toxin-antitoxin module